MGLEVCPCKGCTIETGRSPTCHSNCEKYLKWRQKLDEINAVKRKKIEMELAVWDYNFYNYYNYKKRH